MASAPNQECINRVTSCFIKEADEDSVEPSMKMDYVSFESFIEPYYNITSKQQQQQNTQKKRKQKDINDNSRSDEKSDKSSTPNDGTTTVGRSSSFFRAIEPEGRAGGEGE